MTFICWNCKSVYALLRQASGGCTKYCCGVCREQHRVKVGFAPNEEQRLAPRYLFAPYISDQSR
jgi:hypothetical protein